MAVPLGTNLDMYFIGSNAAKHNNCSLGGSTVWSWVWDEAEKDKTLTGGDNVEMNCFIGVTTITEARVMLKIRQAIENNIFFSMACAVLM